MRQLFIFGGKEGDNHNDPALGKFISADSLIPDPASPQSFNRYAYVLGNPLRYSDPTGHAPQDGIADIDGYRKAVGLAILVLAAQYIPRHILLNWNYGRVATWEAGQDNMGMWAIHTANLLQRGITQVMQNVVLAKQVGPTMQRRGGHNGPASMWSSNITPPGHNGEDPNEDEIARVLRRGKMGALLGIVYFLVEVANGLGITELSKPIEPTPNPTPSPTPSPAPNPTPSPTLASPI